MRYITQWFQEHYLNTTLELTDSLEKYRTCTGPKLNYSPDQIDPKSCWIEPHVLLFEENIRPVPISVSSNGSFPIFFCGKGELGFDIWAASFYLISRYEEYLPYRKDTYGRFDHAQSLAAKHDFLHRPLVDEWMNAFCNSLRTCFPSLSFKTNRFEHLATYDIDESYAYRYKSFFRQLGGGFRDLLQGRIDTVRERLHTMALREKDPYDSFTFIQQLHSPGTDSPIFFFHVGHRRGRYDKNLSPHHPTQIKLIRSLAVSYRVGLHPSWLSGDQAELLSAERQTLEQLSRCPVTSSRQHYIRFQLPDTYNLLLDAGITDEYSMGYGSMNGFRASTSRSFYWFNLQRNQQTSLRVHPFCYMDANSFFESGQSIDQAEAEWKGLEQAVRQVGGRMITIWHNTFLGTQKRFAGWGARYASWLKQDR